MKIRKLQWIYKKIMIKPLKLFEQGILFTFRQAQGIALRQAAGHRPSGKTTMAHQRRCQRLEVP